MTNVTICIVSFGDSAYYSAVYQSVASALTHTDADIFVLTDGGKFDLPDDSRVTHLPVLKPEPHTRRFMTKLQAWRIGLKEIPNTVLVLMDADAVFVSSTKSSEFTRLVREKELAMAEQTHLIPLGWGRLDYWRHYCATSLTAIDANAKPPSPDHFRFLNSGFVVGKKSCIKNFLEWCDDISNQVDFDGAAKTGVTITDQDFIQFWANNLYPDRVSVLDWSWNHCSHWDTDFPRPDARVIHFSSFYNAPTPEVVASMHIARRQ